MPDGCLRRKPAERQDRTINTYANLPQSRQRYPSSMHPPLGARRSFLGVSHVLFWIICFAQRERLPNARATSTYESIHIVRRRLFDLIPCSSWHDPTFDRRSNPMDWVAYIKRVSILSVSRGCRCKGQSRTDMKPARKGARRSTS